jgi:hypothetical protein
LKPPLEPGEPIRVQLLGPVDERLVDAPLLPDHEEHQRAAHLEELGAKDQLVEPWAGPPAGVLGHARTKASP